MSATVAAKPGYVALPLRPCWPRLMPNVRRSMAQVDPELVGVFRRLVAGENPWPLFLHGPVGVGKTLAALSLADHARTAAYFTADGLCNTLLELRDQPAMVRGLWDAIDGKHLVIIDELGLRGNVSEFFYGTIKRVADARELNAGRVGIFISNLDANQLVRIFDDRLGSRLFCGSHFHLTGRDRRFSQ